MSKDKEDMIKLLSENDDKDVALVIFDVAFHSFTDESFAFLPFAVMIVERLKQLNADGLLSKARAKRILDADAKIFDKSIANMKHTSYAKGWKDGHSGYTYRYGTADLDKYNEDVAEVNVARAKGRQL